MGIDPTKLAALANIPASFPEEESDELDGDGGPDEHSVNGRADADQIARLRSDEVGYMELGEPAGAFSCGKCQHGGTEATCTNPSVDSPVSPDHGCCNLFEPMDGDLVFPQGDGGGSLGGDEDELDF